MGSCSHNNKITFKKNSQRSVKFKRYVVLQVNDAAVRIRLVVFASKVQPFIHRLQKRLAGGREERRRIPTL